MSSVKKKRKYKIAKHKRKKTQPQRPSQNIIAILRHLLCLENSKIFSPIFRNCKQFRIVRKRRLYTQIT